MPALSSSVHLGTTKALQEYVARGGEHLHLFRQLGAEIFICAYPSALDVADTLCSALLHHPFCACRGLCLSWITMPMMSYTTRCTEALEWGGLLLRSLLFILRCLLVIHDFVNF